MSAEFASASLTVGQLNALVKKLGGEDVVRSILNGTVEFTMTEIPKPGPADAFFRTRPGLWVSDDFRNLVVAKVSDVAMPVGIKSFDLPNDMSDSVIETELGDAHIWGESDLSATLNQMLIEQGGGGPGKLLNGFFTNLFYTRSCVVGVGWSSVVRRWDIDAWRRDGGRWHAGTRAFAPVS